VWELSALQQLHLSDVSRCGREPTFGGEGGKETAEGIEGYNHRQVCQNIVDRQPSGQERSSLIITGEPQYIQPVRGFARLYSSLLLRAR